MQSLQKNNSKGFTIVELLIVIVVIGILAAIVIVAFNGVQSRANKTAAEQTASQVAKKAEAFNAVKSTYPASTADFATETESKLEGITLGTPSSGNGKTTAQYQICTSPAGFRVNYWDYTASGTNKITPAANAIHGGGATAASTCTTAPATTP